MRSKWFPNKIARYAVGEELKAIRDGKIIVGRDYEFDTREQPKPVEVELVAEEVEVEALQEAPKVQKVKGIEVCLRVHIESTYSC